MSLFIKFEVTMVNHNLTESFKFFNFVVVFINNYNFVEETFTYFDNFSVPFCSILALFGGFGKIKNLRLRICLKA